MDAHRFRFVSDDPAKADGKGQGLGGSDVLALLGTGRFADEREADGDLAVLRARRKGHGGVRRGSRRTAQSVRILTNSLAANDVAMVYGGYSEWREPLLNGGVQLWELKPTRGSDREVEHVRFLGRQPAHQGLDGGRPADVRRQLQPRPALDVAQLRAGRLRRRSRHRLAARGDLQDGVVVGSRVAGDLKDGRSSGATARRRTTVRRTPRWDAGSRPGSPACSRSAHSSDRAAGADPSPGHVG